MPPAGVSPGSCWKVTTASPGTLTCAHDDALPKFFPGHEPTLLQQHLDPELGNLGQKTGLLKLEHEAKRVFKYPTPLLPPPGRGGPSRLQCNLGGLLGPWVDGCRVCGVLPTGVSCDHSGRTPSQRKVRLAERFRLCGWHVERALLLRQRRKQMLSWGPGTVAQRDESAFLGTGSARGGLGRGGRGAVSSEQPEPSPVCSLLLPGAVRWVLRPPSPVIPGPAPRHRLCCTNPTPLSSPPITPKQIPPPHQNNWSLGENREHSVQRAFSFLFKLPSNSGLN